MRQARMKPIIHDQILCFFTYICQNLNLTLQQIQAWLRSVFWVRVTWEKYISSY